MLLNIKLYEVMHNCKDLARIYVLRKVKFSCRKIGWIRQINCLYRCLFFIMRNSLSRNRHWFLIHLFLLFISNYIRAQSVMHTMV